ncbi:MmyB family transcriptional regulator [Catenuloplanes japonicus]|uniref:MmyB family transcriptional regulator n=1 Tax=Catenuloplanes japonicus TaxID=33876 RepID=UPI001E3014A7|nr:hypothetical protein [Catenuloplanes japonicus]
MLAANKAAMALAPLYTPGQNLVHGMFRHPGARALFPDWAGIAAQTAAALRAEGDPRDPATAALIESMLTDDPFREMWSHHDVRRMGNELKRFDHPAVGPLELRRQALTIGGTEGQIVVTYQAEPESPFGGRAGSPDLTIRPRRPQAMPGCCRSVARDAKHRPLSARWSFRDGRRRATRHRHRPR